MLTFARWHIWLGWLVGVPVLLWTVTGLVMVIRPIEVVHGDHLRLPHEAETFVPGTELLARVPEGAQVVGIVQRMEGGERVAILEFADGSKARLAKDGDASLQKIDEQAARAIAAANFVGGDRVQTVTPFPASDPPLDFRRPIAVWQIALEDGTHVYINRGSGEIEAVRTRWWRVFDFMWGLHIMDLQTREDTSHPILIFFAALSAIGATLGCILMFRRRKAQVKA